MCFKMQTFPSAFHGETLTPSACYNLIGALAWLSPGLPAVRDCRAEDRDGRGLRKTMERRGRIKKQRVERVREKESETEKVASQATPALIHGVLTPPGHNGLGNGGTPWL